MVYKYGIQINKIITLVGNVDNLIIGGEYIVKNGSANVGSYSEGEYFVTTETEKTDFTDANQQTLQIIPHSELTVRLIKPGKNWGDAGYITLTEIQRTGWYENDAIPPDNYEIWDTSGGAGADTGKLINIGETIIAE